MVIPDYPYNNDPNLIRQYSDLHLKIKQVETGAIYDEAIDVYPCRYSYVETDEPIEGESR